jgi:hypothetical protein
MGELRHRICKSCPNTFITDDESELDCPRCQVKELKAERDGWKKKYEDEFSAHALNYTVHKELQAAYDTLKEQMEQELIPGSLLTKFRQAEADLDSLSRSVGAALVAATLAPGVRLVDDDPHIIVQTVLSLRRELIQMKADWARDHDQLVRQGKEIDRKHAQEVATLEEERDRWRRRYKAEE